MIDLQAFLQVKIAPTIYLTLGAAPLRVEAQKKHRLIYTRIRFTTSTVKKWKYLKSRVRSFPVAVLDCMTFCHSCVQ